MMGRCAGGSLVSPAMAAAVGWVLASGLAGCQHDLPRRGPASATIQALASERVMTVLSYALAPEAAPLSDAQWHEVIDILQRRLANEGVDSANVTRVGDSGVDVALPTLSASTLARVRAVLAYRGALALYVLASGEAAASADRGYLVGAAGSLNEGQPILVERGEGYRLDPLAVDGAYRSDLAPERARVGFDVAPAQGDELERICALSVDRGLALVVDGQVEAIVDVDRRLVRPVMILLEGEAAVEQANRLHALLRLGELPARLNPR
ncbi:MAG: hypothetical protein AB7O52_18395 [Planctomycetota bacterium]